MTSCQREIKDSQSILTQYTSCFNEKKFIGECKNQCDYEIYNKNDFRESTQKESETKESTQNRKITQNYNTACNSKRSTTCHSSKNIKADENFTISKCQKRSEYINTDTTEQNAPRSKKYNESRHISSSVRNLREKINNIYSKDDQNDTNNYRPNYQEDNPKIFIKKLLEDSHEDDFISSTENKNYISEKNTIQKLQCENLKLKSTITDLEFQSKIYQRNFEIKYEADISRYENNMKSLESKCIKMEADYKQDLSIIWKMYDCFKDVNKAIKELNWVFESRDNKELFGSKRLESPSTGEYNLKSDGSFKSVYKELSSINEQLKNFHLFQTRAEELIKENNWLKNKLTELEKMFKNDSYKVWVCNNEIVFLKRIIRDFKDQNFCQEEKLDYNHENYYENAYTKPEDYCGKNKIFDTDSEIQTVSIINEVYEIENIINELKNAKSHIKNSESMLKENQKEIDTINENIKKVYNKNKDLQYELQKYVSQNSEIMLELKDKSSKIDSLRSLTGQMQEKIENLQIEKNNFLLKYSKIQNEPSKHAYANKENAYLIIEAQKAIEGYKPNQSFNEQKKELLKKNDSLEHEMLSLKITYEDNRRNTEKQHKSKIEENIANTEKMCKKVYEIVNEKTLEIKNLESNLRKSEENHKNLTSSNLEVIKANFSLETHIKELKQKNASLKKAITSLHETFKEEHKNFKGQADYYMAECLKISIKNEELRILNITLDEKIKSNMQILNEKNGMQELQNKIKNLEKKCSELEKNNEILEKDKIHYKKMIDQKKIKIGKIGKTGKIGKVQTKNETNVESMEYMGNELETKSLQAKNEKFYECVDLISL